MRILRNVIRQNPVSRFFQQLDPIDRATVLIVFALALALGLSIHVLWPRYFAAEPLTPAFADPVDMRKAAA